MPARSGSTHVGGVLAALQRGPEDGEPGDLTGSLEIVHRSAKRRGMVVVVSDFLGETTWERPMRSLARRHDVIAIEVVDPREVEIPDVGLISVVDPETDRRRLVDTSKAGTRDRFARVAAERRSRVATAIRACSADHLVLRTDRDWVFDFVRFVSQRRNRMLAAGRTGS